MLALIILPDCCDFIFTIITKYLHRSVALNVITLSDYNITLLRVNLPIVVSNCITVNYHPQSNISILW